MKTFLSFFIIFTLYVFQLPSASAEELHFQAPTVTERGNNSSNQLIIKFKDSTTKSQKHTIFQKVNGKELSTIGNGNFSLISIPTGTDFKKAADFLLTFHEVEFVEPNYKVTTSYTPSDSGYAKQWYDQKIHMPEAWNITFGNPTIKVAVIDAGLQVNHPELKGQIIKPYNAITGGKSIPASVHGTHVAGIIAASMNNGGITGIAPEVKIIPVNVFEGDMADIYTVADGIDYAVEAGADIINLSLTTEDYTEVLDYSIQSAIKKGVLVVAAVGNDRTSRPQYPAAYDHVVAVSATTKSDTRASFSNYGSYINVSAPGVDIYSTVPTSKYTIESGTSMATPIVSGVSALILSKNPFLTPSEVTNILQKSSTDLGVKGWDKYFGYGRVDAYQALLQTPAPISNITKSSNTFTYDGTNQLSLSFNANKGTKISAYITNENSEVIRKLVTNRTWTGGKYSKSWDGTMDNDAYTTEGQVKIIAKVTNGKHTVYKSTYVTVKDNVTPDVTLSKTMIHLSSTAPKKIVIPFHVNKKAMVTAVVYDRNNHKVQTLAGQKLFKGGNQVLAWDGKNSNKQQVKNGAYTLKMSVIDSAKREGKEKTMTITVDSN